MDEDELIESLAEMIEEEIDGVHRAEIIGCAINIYVTFDRPGVPVPIHVYAATIGFRNEKIIFTIHGTDVCIGKDISDPDSFDVVFDKIREMIGAHRGKENMRRLRRGDCDGRRLEGERTFREANSRSQGISCKTQREI